MAVLPSRCFAVLPECRSCPLSAALPRSLHGGGLGRVSRSDGHSVVRSKKEAGTQTHQPQREFSSRWGSCVVVYVPTEKSYSVVFYFIVFRIAYTQGVVNRQYKTSVADKYRRPMKNSKSVACIFYNCATFAIGNGGNGKFEIRSSCP